MAQRAYSSNIETVRTPRSIEFQVVGKTDVASPQNALPKDLRARIFYLAEFTAQHTRKVLRNEDTAVPLLEINAAILGGLQAEGN